MIIQTGIYYLCRAMRVGYRMATERRIDVQKILFEMRAEENQNALKGRIEALHTSNSRFILKTSHRGEWSLIFGGQQTIFGDRHAGFEANPEFFEALGNEMFVWHATWIKNRDGLPELGQLKVSKIVLKEIFNWSGERTLELVESEADATNFEPTLTEKSSQTLQKTDYHSEKWQQAFNKCARISIPNNVTSMKMRFDREEFVEAIDCDVQQLLDFMMLKQREGAPKEHFEFTFTLHCSYSGQTTHVINSRDNLNRI